MSEIHGPECWCDACDGGPNRAPSDAKVVYTEPVGSSGDPRGEET